MNWVLKFSTLTMITVAPSMAAVIIQTGPTFNGFASYFVDANETHEVGFQINDPYMNVQIYANIDGGSQQTPAQGTAYLTNQIGLGTTAAANEIASANFSTTWGTPQQTLLITVPFLAPGAYYLTLGSTSLTTIGWEATAFLQQNTVAPDAVNLGWGRANDANVAAYRPASNFVDAESQGLMYTVTGDVATPEPALFSLIAGAGLLAFAARKKISQ